MKFYAFSTLGRYLMKNFLLSFTGVLVILTSIIYLFEMVDMIRRTSDRDNLGMAEVMLLSLCKMPLTLDMVLPFAVMLGGVITFWRMTRSHELVVIRTSGVSAWQFLRPILFAGFCVGAANTAVINPLSSALYAKYEKMQTAMGLRAGSPLMLSQNGLWVKEPCWAESSPSGA
ncbi:hypothetical protein FACS1894186_1710 [Alphaproteobacteria bacterium]|nr:hypothetical protein FACS1894186_1710 [Alphaproteobacteria bacterium]